MKPSGVVALVAAGVVAGGGVATYELTRPSSEPVQVNYVEPAATVSSEPTTAPTTVPTTVTVKPSPAATATTSTTTASRTIAVTSKSTTHKATVRKEATVANEPAPATSTTPPAPDDPIRSVAPPPIMPNLPSTTPATPDGK